MAAFPWLLLRAQHCTRRLTFTVDLDRLCPDGSYTIGPHWTCSGVVDGKELVATGVQGHAALASFLLLAGQ